MVAGALGRSSATPQTPSPSPSAPGPVVYVVNAKTSTVTPITTATNTPGRPITVGADPGAIAITPDGKTAYVLNSDSVTPITTAANTPGRPVHAAPPR